MLKINGLKQLYLGVIGENLFRTIEIDMSAWMEMLPEGVPSIVAVRPGETKADAYIANTTFEDGILRWEITAGDLGTTWGRGIAEIWMEEEVSSSVTKRGKSLKVITIVDDSADEPSPDTPAAQESWMAQMTALKNATVAAAESTEGYADDAEAYAIGKRGGVDVTSDDPAYHNNSKYYSELAGDSATAAETAQGKAEDAQEAAETAQGKAEDAQEAAENAQEAAETAQGKAEDAQEAAETAQGKAEDAQEAAETAQGKAEDAQDAAETAEENAEAWAVGQRGGIDVESTDPTYHNNAKYYADMAAEDAQIIDEATEIIEGFEADSEAYAIGKRNGVDVGNTDPAYHNNSKYYSEEAAQSAGIGLSLLGALEAIGIGVENGIFVIKPVTSNE